MTGTFYLARPPGSSLTAHALSASVGSGKTRAAVRWMTDPANHARNFLYVAPTRALGEETTINIRAAIAALSGPVVRNVHLVNSDTVEGKTRVEALRGINAVEGAEGQIQILTTQTFLDVLASIRKPALWTVILDEAFAPATFDTFSLGADARGGWDYFREVFDVDRQQGNRIVPKEGRKALVADLADGLLNRTGGKFEGLQKVARAVANPASRCELVFTPRVSTLLAGEELPPKKKEAAESVLEYASYIAPEYFRGFHEVLFLSALFEQTVLYHLWTRALGVTFEAHPEFPVEMLRDTHTEQGRFLAVGHLLHEGDTSSKENLGRSLLTGEPGERTQGQRVLDHVIRTAAAHFGEARFLLQTNKATGYEAGRALVPSNADPIPAYAHGLNRFQGVDNVVALCVTNPTPQQLAWVKERTGMAGAEVTKSFRIHTQYQALGRCSIRRAEQTTDPKTVLVAGADDARFLHGLFPGSLWLGQVGNLPSIRSLSAKAGVQKVGKPEALARLIQEHLDGLPEVESIGSKTLKADLKAGLQSTLGTIQPMVPNMSWPVSSQTWTNAVSLVCSPGSEWRRERGSLVRVKASDYGFSAHGLDK